MRVTFKKSLAWQQPSNLTCWMSFRANAVKRCCRNQILQWLPSIAFLKINSRNANHLPIIVHQKNTVAMKKMMNICFYNLWKVSSTNRLMLVLLNLWLNLASRLKKSKKKLNRMLTRGSILTNRFRSHRFKFLIKKNKNKNLLTLSPSWLSCMLAWSIKLATNRSTSLRLDNKWICFKKVSIC